jgi:2'-5' RNA ligase
VIGVAIAIPDPWGSELQGWRQRFGDPLAEAIPTHVTLLPPTSVDPGALPEIEEHLRWAASRCTPFDIHLRGTASFRPVSPVVFVQLAAGIGGCERTESVVRSGPLTRDLEFPYHPHVTVAHELPDPALDAAFTALATYEARFTVTGFSLYEHIGGVWRPRTAYDFPH